MINRKCWICATIAIVGLLSSFSIAGITSAQQLQQSRVKILFVSGKTSE
ncbi:MAG: hypothetical protein M3P08_01730 [Thermoproteota archaeon]|nr:hypothetical protein [Thermoproteota archaeon]